MSSTVKINIGVMSAIAALVISVGGVVFGAGAMNAKVNINKENIARVEKTIGSELQSIAERLDRVIENQSR